MSNESGDIIIENKDDTATIRTRPCWICGQHSKVNVPREVWRLVDIRDVHVEAAWPEGSAEDKQLILSGVHTKCWDEEFPTDEPKDTE